MHPIKAVLVGMSFAVMFMSPFIGWIFGGWTRKLFERKKWWGFK